MGEHLLCKQGVIGSIPIGSTTSVVARTDTPGDEDTNLPLRRQSCGVCPLFDIVNGFLIDAATRGIRSFKGSGALACVANLAEIIVRTCDNAVVMQGCC